MEQNNELPTPNILPECDDDMDYDCEEDHDPFGYAATMHDDLDSHEEQFVYDLLNVSNGFGHTLVHLMKWIYSGETAKLCVQCTAFSLSCQVTRGALEVSDLVFGNIAVQALLITELVYALLSLCLNYPHVPEGRGLMLVIVNPIAFVHESLRMLCIFQDCGDLYLPREDIEREFEVIPSAISNTDCMITYSAFQERMAQNDRIEQKFDEDMQELSRHADEMDFFHQKAQLQANKQPLWTVTLPRLTAEEDSAFEAYIESVPDDYVTMFECFLFQIYLYVKGVANGDEVSGYLKCEAAMVDLRKGVDTVEVIVIQTRACLQGRGVANMIIWRLMAACSEFNIAGLLVVEALDATVNILHKIGGFYVVGDEDAREYEIPLHLMCTKTLAVYGLVGKLTEHENHKGFFVVSPESLPAASWLHDKDAVMHFLSEKQKQRKARDMQSLESASLPGASGSTKST